MKHPALLTLGLALVAGAVMAAEPLDRLAPLQGDWPSGGSVVSIKGSSARVTRLSARDRKAGYSDGDMLVQGLAYQRTDVLNNGDRRATYAGVCRTPTAGGGSSRWVVSDCTLLLTRPGDGGPPRLTAVNASPLIGDRREAPPAVQTAANRNTGDLAGARVQAPPPRPPADPNDTLSRRRMTPEELAAQDAGTRRLNADISARNAAIEARNRKAEADFRAARAARDGQIRASRAAYAREMADYQARIAARNAATAKAQADWEAAVKACRAGDRTQCARPKPK